MQLRYTSGSHLTVHHFLHGFEQKPGGPKFWVLGDPAGRVRAVHVVRVVHVVHVVHVVQTGLGRSRQVQTGAGRPRQEVE